MHQKAYNACGVVLHLHKIQHPSHTRRFHPPKCPTTQGDVKFRLWHIPLLIASCDNNGIETIFGNSNKQFSLEWWSFAIVTKFHRIRTNACWILSTLPHHWTPSCLNSAIAVQELKLLPFANWHPTFKLAFPSICNYPLKILWFGCWTIPGFDT